MEKGKLIVIEGASDGIGKSSQCKLLCEEFVNNNVPFTMAHFPTYGGYQAKGVENYLQGNFGEIKDLSPYFVTNIYAFDRMITWHTKLKKHYDNGEIILLDRYTTSSLIYQSTLIDDMEERKAFIDWVIDYEYNKLNIKKPDLVIFLTATYKNIVKLRKSRTSNDGISNDIYEQNDELLKKVYENALFVADYLGWEKVVCDNENGMKPIEEIHDDIMHLLRK